jgi:ABC-type transport system substrate-binding protein
LYGAIDRTVARDVPIVYLFNPQYVYVYRTRLRGFAPNAFTPTWNAYAWSIAAAPGRQDLRGRPGQRSR